MLDLNSPWTLLEARTRAAKQPGCEQTQYGRRQARLSVEFRCSFYADCSPGSYKRPEPFLQSLKHAVIGFDSLCLRKG